LWHASWHLAHGLIASPSLVAQKSLPVFQRNMQESLPHMLVAEDDERILGLAVAREGTLEHLYAHPDAIGTGVGRSLLNAAEDSLRRTARGGTAQVIVASRNLHAIQFYEKHGWVRGGALAASSLAACLASTPTLDNNLQERVAAAERQLGGLRCKLYIKSLVSERV
jgi:predicted N-acetyltransferase YhbS